MINITVQTVFYTRHKNYSSLITPNNHAGFVHLYLNIFFVISIPQCPLQITRKRTVAGIMLTTHDNNPVGTKPCISTNATRPENSQLNCESTATHTVNKANKSTVCNAIHWCIVRVLC